MIYNLNFKYIYIYFTNIFLLLYIIQNNNNVYTIKIIEFKIYINFNFISYLIICFDFQNFNL